LSAQLTRRAAAELLIETLENRRMLDEALETAPTYNSLEGADRGFARAIASAALRQLGRIDAGLKPFLNRPLEDAGKEARALLRAGAAQAWEMGTPAHAVVSETVNAAKAWEPAKNAAGFLNAVMRKVAHDRAAFDAAPAMTVWPDWLQKTMTASLGPADALALATAQQTEPELHITPKASATETPGEPLPGGTHLVPGGGITDLPGYKEGDWWVQDRAAALPARMMTVSAGETVIDLCAAPGGKTLQLADTGATVIAVDRSKKRLDVLKENLARTGLGEKVDVIAANAERWVPPQPVDKILLDAPCSALGTLRRHPEGAWIKREEDVARFPDIQGRLLRAAAKMVKPGGLVVYCVCTPISAEGRDVVEGAIVEGLFKRAPLPDLSALGFEGCATGADDVLTIPRNGVSHDAFYIAMLTRL